MNHHHTGHKLNLMDPEGGSYFQNHEVISSQKNTSTTRFRRFFSHPDRLAERYVKPGNRAHDFGCGPGPFRGRPGKNYRRVSALLPREIAHQGFCVARAILKVNYLQGIRVCQSCQIYALHIVREVNLSGGGYDP